MYSFSIRLRSLSCSLAFFAALLLPFGALSAKDPKALPKRPGPPTVLIVATRYYNPKNGLVELPHALESAIELATEFDKMGSKVVLLTDQQSVGEVKKPLQSTKVIVDEANDGETLFKTVSKWMTTTEAAHPPLSLLVLVGHGEERGKIPYYLCRDDAPGQDGMSMSAVEEATSQRPELPLVIVYDACRKAAPQIALNIKDRNGKPIEQPGTPPGPNTPESSEASAADRYQSRGDSVKFTNASNNYPTVLYACRSDKSAVDAEDLTHHLSKFLKFDNDVRTFIKWSCPELKVALNDLTLFEWFYYGIVRVLGKSDLKQSHEIRVGSVPLTATVARLNQGKVVGPKKKYEEINVISEFHPLWGQFESSFDDAVGWVITHPAAGLQKDTYKDGTLGDADGYETAGRVLKMDVVPTYLGEAKSLTSVLPYFMLKTQLTYHFPGSEKYIDLSDNDHQLPVSFNRVQTIIKPLWTIPKGPRQPAYGLNDFGVALHGKPANPWPPNTSLTILNLKLASAPESDPLVQSTCTPMTMYVLGHWFPGDQAADNRGAKLKVTVGFRSADGVGVRLEQSDPARGLIRCGGEIYPPVYIPADNDLVLDVVNTDRSRDASLSVELLRMNKDNETEHSFISGKTVTIPAGTTRPATTILLKGSGYANYLGLGTNAKSVLIRSITIKPGDPTKRPK